jgi:hypothetical protein
MDKLIWAGTTMRVTIDKTDRSTPAGRWNYDQSRITARPVYAVGYRGGEW